MEIDGQLSLFSMRPAVIDNLEKELDLIFGKSNKEEDSDYSVWEHVPTLGKRLCIWYEIERDSWDDKKTSDLIEKYKKHNLELSYCSCPIFGDDKYTSETSKIKIMCSTLWKTKGHSEIY